MKKFVDYVKDFCIDNNAFHNVAFFMKLDVDVFWSFVGLVYIDMYFVWSQCLNFFSDAFHPTDKRMFFLFVVAIVECGALMSAFHKLLFSHIIES